MAVQSKDRSSANFTVHLRREDDILSKPLRQVKLRILPKHQSHRNYVEEPDFGKVFLIFLPIVHTQQFSTERCQLCRFTLGMLDVLFVFSQTG